MTFAVFAVAAVVNCLSRMNSPPVPESPYAYRTMTLADYDAVTELLGVTEGVVLRAADSRPATARYLERNPGLSFVCCEADAIVGCVFAGHDGRRGYLQHLAVGADYRRRGIGSALVACCVAELERIGIEKCHLDVLAGNAAAAGFWSRRGGQRRCDIVRYSLLASHDANA